MRKGKVRGELWQCNRLVASSRRSRWFVRVARGEQEGGWCIPVVMANRWLTSAGVVVVADSEERKRRDEAPTGNDEPVTHKPVFRINIW